MSLTTDVSLKYVSKVVSWRRIKAVAVGGGGQRRMRSEEDDDDGGNWDDGGGSIKRMSVCAEDDQCTCAFRWRAPVFSNLCIYVLEVVHVVSEPRGSRSRIIQGLKMKVVQSFLVNFLFLVKRRIRNIKTHGSRIQEEVFGVNNRLSTRRQSRCEKVKNCRGQQGFLVANRLEFHYFWFVMDVLISAANVL
ncbi:hypothetical protein Tco_0933640, partial [Tanacetum coccineum]